MRYLDVKKLIPDIYCQESRDFQILCNIYSSVVNAVKFDSDNLFRTLDTATCRGEFLELLGTRLGFFPKKDFSAESLRNALIGFKDLTYNKGSLGSVASAVNVFLRSLGIHNKVKITLTTDNIEFAGRKIKDHTVIISIESAVKDTSLLDEIFKYIIPFGYEYIITFYLQIDPYDQFEFHENVTLIYTSDLINSTIKGGESPAYTGAADRVMKAVDTVEVIGEDSDIDHNPSYNLITPQFLTAMSNVTSGAKYYEASPDGSITIYRSDDRSWASLTAKLPVSSTTQYSFSRYAGIRVQLDEYNAFDNIIIAHDWTANTPDSEMTFTTTSSTTYVKLKLAPGLSSSSYPITIKPQLETGSVHHNFTQYRYPTELQTYNFRGLGSTRTLLEIEDPVAGDIVGVLSGDLYYVYNSSFTEKTFAGTYLTLESIPSPIDESVVFIKSDQSYRYRTGNGWVTLNLRGRLKNIEDSTYTDLHQYDLVITNRVVYYLYNNSGWNVYNYPIKVYGTVTEDT